MSFGRLSKELHCPVPEIHSLSDAIRLYDFIFPLVLTNSRHL